MNSESRSSIWSRASFSAKAVPPLELPLGTYAEVEQPLAKPALPLDTEPHGTPAVIGNSRDSFADDASDRPQTPSASSGSVGPEPARVRPRGLVLQPEASHGAGPPSTRRERRHGAPRRPDAGPRQARGRWGSNG